MNQTNSPRGTSGKRVYESPKLKVHGDLKKLTTAKAGDKSDGGGKPATRTSGGMA